MGFPLTLQRYSDWFQSMWNIHGNQSNLEQIDRLAFIQPILFVLTAFNANTLVLAKVLVAGLLLVSGLTAYGLARALVRVIAPGAPLWVSTVLGAAAGTVYEFGPSVMYLASAYFYLLAYALAPLLILLLFRSAARGRLWWLFALAGGLLLTMAAASPQHTVFLSFGLFCLAVVLMSRYGLRRVFPGVALFYIAFVASSLYWIVPTVPLAFSGALTPGYQPDWVDTLLFSRNATLPNVLTGYSEWLVWWTPGGFWPAGVLSLLYLCRFVLPACALLVGIVAWNNWVVRYAFVLLLALALAAMGASSPLGPAYHFAMFQIPALNSVGWFVRDPGKLDGYLWLVTVMLGVVGAALLLRGNRSKLAVGIVVAIPLVTFASALPKNLAGFDDKYLPIPIPAEYYQVAAELANMPGATLWLAPYYDASSGFAGSLAYSWAPDRLAASFVRDSLPGNTFAAYAYTDPFTQEYAYLYSHPENISRKLAVLGITNVVLADDLVGGHAGFLRLQGYLTADPSITLVRKVGEHLYLYAGLVHASAPIDRFIAVQGGRASQEYVYSPSYLDFPTAHLIYAEQQQDPGWLTSSIYSGQVSWLLTDRSDIDVAMDKFVVKYGIPFSNLSDNSGLYEGWGRTQTAMPTSAFWPWHVYLSSLLGVPDAWDFDFGRGIVWSASLGVSLHQSRITPAGQYELLVRAFTSVDSSTLGISIGDTTRFVPLNSPSQSDLRWFDLGQIALARPESSVTLQNGNHHGVVNMVALVPSSEFRQELGRVRNLFQVSGLSVVTNGLESQPSNQYLPADTYTVSSLGPVRVVDLQGDSVLAPSGGTVTIVHAGNYAITPGSADHMVLALNVGDWTGSQAVAMGFQSNGSGTWRETRAPTNGFSYMRSRSVPLSPGCQSMVVAGNVDVDQVGSFSAGVQFFAASGSLMGDVQTVKGKEGSVVGLNIGGVVRVPQGASQVAVLVADMKSSPGAALGNPVIRLLCNNLSTPTGPTVSLTGKRFGQASGANFVVHDAAYDPQWVLVSQSGGTRIPGVPVDGAITLFPGGRVNDKVTYAADESLALGWRLSALATSLVLLVCLVLACRVQLGLRIRRWLIAR